MKIILLILFVFPSLTIAQELKQDFNFIIEFKNKLTLISSENNGELKDLKNEKKNFDNKVQHLITHKNILIDQYFNAIVEQERKDLNKILESTTNSKDLENELLKWKKDPKLFALQNSVLDLFSKLEYLQEESNAINNSTDDFMLVVQFESRLEEIVEIIKNIKYALEEE